MIRLLKILFFVAMLFSLSNCEEREVLNARKKNGSGGTGGTVQTTRNFIASFVSGGVSQTVCPNGPGASIILDYSTGFFEFQIPTRDTTNAPSDLLEAANTAKILEGNPSLNSQTGAFSGSYTVDDPNGDLDITVCDNTNGGYADVTRLSMSGTVNNSGDVTGTYEIVNLCNTGTTTVVVCEGSLTGSENVQ